MDPVAEEEKSYDIVSRRLRKNMVSSVKEIFAKVDWDKSNVIQLSMPELKSSVNDIIDTITDNRQAFLNMMDLKKYHDYTYYHSVNVATIAIVLGVAAKLGRRMLYELGMGALLHDIGKVFIEKDLLDKPDKLSYEEFETMKMHSRLGYDYLKDRWGVSDVSSIAVLTHHEKYDGSGYPFGLKGEKQTFFGQIIAISDVYDALTSDRPYRLAVSPSEAMEYVMGSSGSLFDPKVVQIFLSNIYPYPVGTCVELSNGQKGIVIENQSKCGLRPQVQLFSDSESPVVIDLYNDQHLLNVTITGKAKTETVFSQRCAIQTQ